MNFLLALEYLTHEPTVHVIDSWFWIPFLIGAALIGGAAIIIANTGGSETTTVSGKKLGILGMQESGKTLLLRNMQGKPYSGYAATSTEDYSKFSMTMPSGRRFEVQAGRDIGGDELYIRDYYEQFINDKDITIFVFDVKKYLYNEKYANDVRARLDFIYDKIKKNGNYRPEGIPAILFSAVLTGKNHVVIGSHFDQLSKNEQKSALGKLQTSVEGKVYAPLFHYNLCFLDLTNWSNCLKYFEEKKIFS